MLGPKHHPNRADPISEFMQDHGERHDPADLTACLKGSANGNAIEKAMHPDARGSPGSGLTGMIVVRRMILYLAMVRGVLEQIEKQKPQGAGEEGQNKPPVRPEPQGDESAAKRHYACHPRNPEWCHRRGSRYGSLLLR